MTASATLGRLSPLAAFIVAVGRRLLPPNPTGRLSVCLPSGRRIEIGQHAAAESAELRLRSWRPLWRAMRRASVGFCESYIDGDWDSAAPEKVFAFYLRNRPTFDKAGRAIMRKSLAVKAWHRLRANTRRGARKNIEAHYDLGNAFYAHWLDRSMSYSSGYFGGGAATLEAAQEAKYALVADALDLRPGQRLLEIGCGWGGFANAASARGAAVTGITLSREQLAHAENLELPRAEFRLQDYRDVTERFDRIASIEMIEAVGEENWPAYFGVLADRLEPGGIAAIQAITINERYFEQYRANPDFIQRHIFPGGMLPTSEIIRREANAHGLQAETVCRFGRDYARTLRYWRERFDAAAAGLAEMGFDERFRRKWRLYLCYCEAGFAEGAIDVGVYRLTKPGYPAREPAPRDGHSTPAKGQ